MCPNLATNSTNFGPFGGWVDFDRISTEFDHWPRDPPKFGQIWFDAGKPPKLAGKRPNLARPTLILTPKHGPRSTMVGPEVTNIGPTSARFGEICPTLAGSWPDSARTRIWLVVWRSVWAVGLGGRLDGVGSVAVGCGGVGRSDGRVAVG